MFKDEFLDIKLSVNVLTKLRLRPLCK